MNEAKLAWCDRNVKTKWNTNHQCADNKEDNKELEYVIIKKDW